MYVYAQDKAQGMMVGLLGRPFDVEEDNQQILDSILRQNTDALSPAAGGVFVMIVDPNCPNPTPHWRRKFAEARDGLRFARYLYALVTPAPSLKGVLTAVNWMSHPTSRFEAESFTSFDEAVRWVEGKRGRPLPVLGVLLDSVNSKFGYPSSSQRAKANPQQSAVREHGEGAGAGAARARDNLSEPRGKPV